MSEEKADLEAIIHLARQCRGVTVREVENGYLLTKAGAVLGQCPHCSFAGKPDANYCGKCGYALKEGLVGDMESRAIKLCEQATTMLQSIMSPKLEDIKKGLDEILENSVTTRIDSEKLYVSKKGKLTNKDRALLKAFIKREKAFEAARAKYIKALKAHGDNGSLAFARILRIPQFIDTRYWGTEAKLEGESVVITLEKPEPE